MSTKKSPAEIALGAAALIPKAKPAVEIPQPELRPLDSHERVVTTGGLKFILPCAYKVGDVLSEESAAFINAAHHAALINRFGELRRDLMSRPNATYETIDDALQLFARDFKVTPRDTSTQAGPQEPERTDEDRELEAYARPLFNKALQGHGLSRKEYEAQLREFVRNNREAIVEARDHEKASITKLTKSIAKLGEDSAEGSEE